MNKSEFVYVIVRLIGVIFLPYAGLAILNLLGTLILVSDTAIAKAATGSLTLDTGIQLATGLVIGLYLIVDGNLLFSIFDREG